MIRVLVLLVMASAANAQCDRAGRLTSSGVGPVAIGITPDSLKRVCRVVSQQRVPEYSMTILRVQVGPDTVRAFERDGRISWIEVDSPRIRTRDSIGVGSSAAAILHSGNVDGGAGDGTNTFALTMRSGPHCGLTFWLDAATAEMLNAGRGDRIRLLGMRGGGVVTQVDISGACQPGAGR